MIDINRLNGIFEDAVRENFPSNEVIDMSPAGKNEIKYQIKYVDTILPYKIAIDFTEIKPIKNDILYTLSGRINVTLVFSMFVNDFAHEYNGRKGESLWVTWGDYDHDWATSLGLYFKDNNVALAPFTYNITLADNKQFIYGRRTIISRKEKFMGEIYDINNFLRYINAIKYRCDKEVKYMNDDLIDLALDIDEYLAGSI